MITERDNDKMKEEFQPTNVVKKNQVDEEHARVFEKPTNKRRTIDAIADELSKKLFAGHMAAHQKEQEQTKLQQTDFYHPNNISIVSEITLAETSEQDGEMVSKTGSEDLTSHVMNLGPQLLSLNKRRSIEPIADVSSNNLFAKQKAAHEKAKEQQHVDRISPAEFSVQSSEAAFGAISENKTPDMPDYGLGTSNEQIQTFVDHLLNRKSTIAAATPAPGELSIKSRSEREKSDSTTPIKRQRKLPKEELEGIKSLPVKSCRLEKCGLKYNCTLCNTTTALNPTASRWNLLRHVIQKHSNHKPFKCEECDYHGIKGPVRRHAEQNHQRSGSIIDMTTDEMREEWDNLMNECFPEYFQDKERGWKSKLVIGANMTENCSN